jgi:hypothetical protein
MKTSKQFYRDSLGWGFILWLFGYILGIILFKAVPPLFIGWIITPLATLITLWVLIKKINNQTFQYYLVVGITWTVIAMVLDYFFIVKLFKPEDGYYKTDVYLYYALTFLLPLMVGWRKQTKVMGKKMV